MIARDNVQDYCFCPHCSTRLVQAERFGRQRQVCPACGWVYFADPKVAAAVLVEHDGQVLFVRRANDPMRGLWTLPAGFVDADENPQRAAERECLEETGLVIQVTDLLDVIYGQEHPRGAHIIIAYRGKIISGQLQPGDDVDQVAFYRLDELPELAFETTHKILGLIY